MTWWPLAAPFGTALRQIGDTAGAIDAYRSEINVLPPRKEILADLAGMLATQGRAQEASRYYQAALALDPNDATAQQNLATMLAQTGQIDEAIVHNRRALAIDPGGTDAAHRTCWSVGPADSMKPRTSTCSCMRLNPRSAEAHDGPWVRSCSPVAMPLARRCILPKQPGSIPLPLRSTVIWAPHCSNLVMLNRLSASGSFHCASTRTMNLAEI